MNRPKKKWLRGDKLFEGIKWIAIFVWCFGVPLLLVVSESNLAHLLSIIWLIHVGIIVWFYSERNYWMDISARLLYGGQISDFWREKIKTTLERKFPNLKENHD